MALRVHQRLKTPLTHVDLIAYSSAVIVWALFLLWFVLVQSVLRDVAAISMAASIVVSCAISFFFPRAFRSNVLSKTIIVIPLIGIVYEIIVALSYLAAARRGHKPASAGTGIRCKK